MKPHRISLFLLSIVCFLFLSKGNSFSQDSISHLAEKYKTSVVAVIALDQENRTIRSGSGFFVDRQGVLATSHHVLEGAAKAMVRLVDRQEGEVLDILGDDPGCDLLTAKTSLQNTFPIPFGDSDKIAKGEEVLIIGHFQVGKESYLPATSLVREEQPILSFCRFQRPIGRVQRCACFEQKGRSSRCSHGFCRTFKGSQLRSPCPIPENAQTRTDKLEIPPGQVRPVPGIHGRCYGH